MKEQTSICLQLDLVLPKTSRARVEWGWLEGGPFSLLLFSDTFRVPLHRSLLRWPGSTFACVKNKWAQKCFWLVLKELGEHQESLQSQTPPGCCWSQPHHHAAPSVQSTWKPPTAAAAAAAKVKTTTYSPLCATSWLVPSAAVYPSNH